VVLHRTETFHEAPRLARRDLPLRIERRQDLLKTFSISTPSWSLYFIGNDDDSGGGDEMIKRSWLTSSLVVLLMHSSNRQKQLIRAADNSGVHLQFGGQIVQSSARYPGLYFSAGHRRQEDEKDRGGCACADGPSKRGNLAGSLAYFPVEYRRQGRECGIWSGRVSQCV
jgi:hypothetical protein